VTLGRGVAGHAWGDEGRDGRDVPITSDVHSREEQLDVGAKGPRPACWERGVAVTEAHGSPDAELPPEIPLSRRHLLAGAAGLAGVAGLTRLPGVGAHGLGGAMAQRATPSFDVRAHGAAGTGRADDTEAIRATFVAAQGAAAAGVPGASVYFPQGEYVISSTIALTRFSGIVYGDGQGQSPAFTSQPGHGTVLRWMGDDGSPMIEVVDSLVVKICDLRLEGRTQSPPTFGIEFRGSGGDVGCNHYCTVEDVTIGRYPWSSQGADEGAVQSCIGYTGVDGNNDQFHLNRVRFNSPSRYGLFLPNTQSIWGSLRDCFFDRCGTAGLATNADTSLYNCSFNRCAIDVRAGIEDATLVAPNVSAFGWYSEHTRQMANVSPNAKLTVHGGVIQCGAVQAGRHLLIDAYPSDSQTISLHTITFTQMRSPHRVRIRFGPQAPTFVGRVFLNVEACRGIEPSQLELAGAMWAANAGAMSRAVVEWQSTDGLEVASKYVYQFRNELAHHGRGTRARLDASVWDRPVAGKH
jgi:hypothetical protein